jgi:hypothetical protein
MMVSISRSIVVRSCCGIHGDTWKLALAPAPSPARTLFEEQITYVGMQGVITRRNLYNVGYRHPGVYKDLGQTAVQARDAIPIRQKKAILPTDFGGCLGPLGAGPQATLMWRRELELGSRPLTYTSRMSEGV